MSFRQITRERPKNQVSDLRRLNEFARAGIRIGLHVAKPPQRSNLTNYAPLISNVLEFNRTGEEVCLVTFNYDLVLERALYTFDFKRKTPDEHLDSHPILKLFKLHGSVD
jgi:hypothetical protein